MQSCDLLQCRHKGNVLSRRSNNGVVRRPIEYVLIVAAAALVLFLIWSVMVIRSDNQQADTSGQLPAQRELQGSLDEVNRLAEEDSASELEIDKDYDQQELEAASADAAADNIGGVYDETSY